MDLTRRFGVKQVSNMDEDLLEAILMRGLNNQPTYRHRCKGSCILPRWLSLMQRMTIYPLLNLLIIKVLVLVLVAVEQEEEEDQEA